MRRFVTTRNRDIVTGAIGLVVLVALVTIGIKASFGAFDGGYHLRGSFAAAGQGMLSGSDVKIRGVNVGEVRSIELVENRAVITMRIEDGTQIPVTAGAVVRPKTLFGEKFIDIEPGSDEFDGPYLDDGDEIVDTRGGFELEQVLADAYPILDAIDPAELAVVLDELARAGDGLGQHINRSIVNGAALARLQAGNDAEIRQFLGDLALLSEEIDRLAPDLVATARDLNAALPSLNERGDRLNAALVDIAGISSDVADLLEANEDFTTTALTDGSRGLQVLFDRRSQIQPLLLGVERYTRTISEVIRIDVGDGTMMAAIKNLVDTHQSSHDGREPGGASHPSPLDRLAPDVRLPGASDLLGGTGSTSTTTTPLLDILLGGDR